MEDDGSHTLEMPLPLVRKKNWPICKPILYHDIQAEVEPRMRRIVWMGYVGWYALILVYFWNLLSVMAVLFSDGGFSKFFSSCLAAIYLLFGPMIGFFGYKKLYDLGVDLKSMNYGLWCLIFVPQAIFAVFLAFGIEGTGGSGLVEMIYQYRDNDNAAALFNLISLLLWGLVITYDVYMIIAVRLTLSAAKSPPTEGQVDGVLSLDEDEEQGTSAIGSLTKRRNEEEYVDEEIHDSRSTAPQQQQQPAAAVAQQPPPAVLRNDAPPIPQNFLD
eukprot:TRINITY_DN1036_c0_g1_i1.p1 TRINITY_DN1036_c0_g1~~TRINITY_DN1036_c0_g1_i1.p1  ORF type:complete len:273 (+),score=50.51 TRINITY_DN1036_c0_g1_i1:53-871(+)